MGRQILEADPGLNHVYNAAISINASVNSSSAHPPPGLTPGHKHILQKIGRIPRGGDEKRGQMPRPRDRRLPTLLQFFY